MAPENTPLVDHPVHAIIRNRRTIKPAFMDPERPVDRGTIELLLENATWAPTHGMTEPWRFWVFIDEGKKQLSEKLREWYRALTPPEAHRPEKEAKLGANPLLAQAVIVIGMERDPSGKISETDELAATACAVQNLHLTASALGLAGFWSSPPLVESEPMRAFLQLGEGGRCLGLFYLGWPRANWEPPRSSRRPLAEKVRWIGSE